MYTYALYIYYMFIHTGEGLEKIKNDMRKMGSAFSGPIYVSAREALLYMADEIVIDINKNNTKKDNDVETTKIENKNMLVSALHSFLPVDPPNSSPTGDKSVISNLKKEWSKAINMIFEESLKVFKI
jgi:hypothetical protein